MDPIAELRRRLDNMIRPGTIYAVDHAKARCRVKTGELLTQWLPWFAHRAGSVRHWSPPSLNEQCMVISPSGELAAGFVLVGINSLEYPAPSSSGTENLTEYADGSWTAYDQATVTLTVYLRGGGNVLLRAPAGVLIEGNVHIEGTVTVSQDVIADGVSLTEHIHGGVQGGSSTTGEPQ